MGGISLPDPVLSIDISVDYPRKPGVLKHACLEVFPGEILGLVGQSGSGKSTLALAILQLLDSAGGRVSGKSVLLGRDLTAMNERELRQVRGRLLALIPQSPLAALNPALRIDTQLAEAWRAHSSEPWPGQADRIAKLFDHVGLPEAGAFLRRFPREISVGQAQRVLILMALLHSPALLIADEPTSALDLITQREVLTLLSAINRERQMSVLFISHDLLTVASLCHRIAILHDGSIVEAGPANRVMSAPEHPFTRQLVAAVQGRI